MSTIKSLRTAVVGTTALFAIGGLAGCSTAEHKCPLGEDCTGSKEVYDAAVAGGGDNQNVLPGAGRPKGETGEQQASGLHGEGRRGRVPGSVDRDSDSGSEETGRGQWNPYDGGSLSERPVYQPPKPVRIWVAPWRDQDGILRSGQYLYVTQDGGWQFGELRSPGAGSRILRPRPPTAPEADDAGQGRVQPRQTMMPGGGQQGGQGNPDAGGQAGQAGGQSPMQQLPGRGNQ